MRSPRRCQPGSRITSAAGASLVATRTTDGALTITVSLTIVEDRGGITTGGDTSSGTGSGWG